jgi:cytochrome c
MTRTLCASLFVLVALIGGAALGADRFASADDGKAMLERAVTALKTDPAAALKQFNDEKNKQFRDRDLFVFCFGLPDGNFTSFQSPVMLGTDVRELKYQDEPIGQHAYDTVANAAEGDFVTIEYNFPKPGTKTAATKQSLETRIGKQACGVTYFK